MYANALVGLILLFVGFVLLRRTERARTRPHIQLLLSTRRDFRIAFFIAPLVELAFCVGGLLLVSRVSKALAGLLLLVSLAAFIWGRRVTSDEAVICMVFQEYREQKARATTPDDQVVLRATARGVLGRLGWEKDKVDRVLGMIFNDVGAGVREQHFGRFDEQQAVRLL